MPMLRDRIGRPGLIGGGRDRRDDRQDDRGDRQDDRDDRQDDRDDRQDDRGDRGLRGRRRGPGLLR
jgi:hypothetical protein